MNKQRLSNIELLRIVAMFLVLLVHADFKALGEPTISDIQNNTWDASLRVMLQSISISCVDIFILISGWFGIKPTLRGIGNFLFQCVFFILGLYALSFWVGHTEYVTQIVKDALLLTDGNWFIKAYLLLYILSPALNAYVEKASEKQIRNTILYFYVFQTLYGWLYSDAVGYIRGGYSTVPFIGLYLLARYINIYKPKWSFWKGRSYLYLILIVNLGLTVTYIVPAKYLHIDLTAAVLKCISVSYIAPTTIVTAVSMLLMFNRMNFVSKWVNWVAASAFAVYLVHTHPVLSTLYSTAIKTIHQSCGIVSWILIMLFLVFVFVGAVLVDKIRIIIWKKILTKI